ncbi:hypothetical protein ACFQE1_11530 [Halobium palmae]|uniref:Uncharacterized protein n=1 Tax=Halobium palmae TaxID=1776492 RepID=A0ABD5S0B1_9EURY
MTEDSEREQVRRMIETLQEISEGLDEETKRRLRERVEYSIDEGNYESAELHAPDDVVYAVGPVHVWGSGFSRGRQNVDLFIEQVPEHLRDSGLAECELTIYSANGVPLLHGSLEDDGNRQDGLGRICVVVVDPKSESEERTS